MRYVVVMLGFVQPGGVIKEGRNIRRDHDYISKELAIVSLDDNSDPIVLLFKEPFPWSHLTKNYKDINTYLRRHYHGLYWKSGTLPYTSIGTLLKDSLKDATTVYVAGSIQKKWLERFKFNVKNIAEYSYPPIDKIKMVTICENHNGEFKTSCALHNVKLLKKFITQSEALDVEEPMEWV